MDGFLSKETAQHGGAARTGERAALCAWRAIILRPWRSLEKGAGEFSAPKASAGLSAAEAPPTNCETDALRRSMA
jgi:hypothetical protein